jgi:hypothetical protein
MTGSKVARFLTVSLLVVLVAGLAIVWSFFLTGHEAQSKIAVSLFQKTVQPLGTALLTALYYWSEYLKPKEVSSTAVAMSDSSARSDVVSSAAPNINISVNTVQNPPSPPSFVDIDELVENVAKKIAEKGNVIAASVVAEKFVLVDGSGKRRALLGLTDAGAAGLWSFDVDGRQRLWIGVGNDQEPILSLISRDGTTRLAVVDTETITGLSIRGNSGKALLNLMGHADDTRYLSSVVLCDPNSESQVALYSGPLSPPVLFAKDKDGKTVWSYPPVLKARVEPH